MNLESLASELRGFVGITRKKQIGSIIQIFPVDFKRIIASFGEDAAVIDDGDEVMLLEADGVSGPGLWRWIQCGQATALSCPRQCP